MGTPKVWSDICMVQIACEGDYLRHGNRICGKCTQEQRKRKAIKNAPLRGEYYCASEDAKVKR
jgi:hypothetical protein